MSKGGRMLAVAVAGVAAVIDLQANSEQARFTSLSGVWRTALSPNARWLACCAWHGAGVRVFDLQDNSLAFSASADDASMGFSPDGRWLVTGTGYEYRFWSTGDWQPGPRIARNAGLDLAGPLAFSPGGNAVAVVPAWNIVRLVDVSTGSELASFEAPDVYDRISAVSFSPDGGLLVAGSLCHRLHVWDLRLVRRRLASMGLDWDSPALPPADAEPGVPAVEMTVLQPSGPWPPGTGGTN